MTGPYETGWLVRRSIQTNLEDFMKIVKLSFILVAAVAVLVGFSTASYAYHAGGVARCMGCHNIHDAVTYPLLSAGDASSVCLNCHNSTSAGSYHISTDDTVMPAGTAPLNMTPGGDFGWLKKTYSWTAHGRTSTEDGDSHGHNIVAGDFGYAADVANTQAPGGTMFSNVLACNSCHDPHGKLRRLNDGTFATTGAPIISSGSYNNNADPGVGEAVGAYRLLRGPGSGSGPGGQSFSGVFNAVVPSSYNRAETTFSTRVAYGAGISGWCATCHPEMHTATTTKLTHLTDVAMGTSATNYNAYVGSGDMSGTGNTYDSIVPFQTDNSTDYVALRALAVNDGSVMTGPTAGLDKVMCLSCHRAHASGFESMTRWQNGAELIVVDGVWPGSDAASVEAQGTKWARGRTAAETSRAYNDKPASSYATYQRSLCNKCHAQD